MSKAKMFALLGMVFLVGLLTCKTNVSADGEAFMDRHGNITYDTEDTKASSGIRYRTLGIMIEPHETGGVPNWNQLIFICN